MRKMVTITKVAETFAFGITKDTYEQVYIPASIVKSFILEEGEDIEFAVVPNKNDRSQNVPWFATFLIEDDGPEDEPQPEPVKLDLKAEALKAMASLPENSIFTTSLVAELINRKHGTNHEADNISAYLDALHTEGNVARAAVNQTKSDKAKYSLWALDYKAFKTMVTG